MAFLRKRTSSKESKTASAEMPAEQSQTPEELGYFDVISKLMKMGDDKTLKVYIRNQKKLWKPFIKDVKKLVSEIQKNQPESKKRKNPPRPTPLIKSSH